MQPQRREQDRVLCTAQRCIMNRFCARSPTRWTLLIRGCVRFCADCSVCCPSCSRFLRSRSWCSRARQRCRRRGSRQVACQQQRRRHFFSCRSQGPPSTMGSLDSSARCVVEHIGTGRIWKQQRIIAERQQEAGGTWWFLHKTGQHIVGLTQLQAWFMSAPVIQSSMTHLACCSNALFSIIIITWQPKT